ncbi:uncharacterized protein EI97DRAFT_454971 [Westerdykella ornata]|uniref:Phytase-like domain-containing protein n=1 Tax=Westerdykella ornata TaxID=318751 RepID=A0A6A6JTV8_WESOR|nr:uncharacterized protein EI97DRAFT_454971 [Westerdykella ornata]KAF2280041.1 hypothetical protein EI97DRAFT_454971 [Westerdykella ornata]
MLCFKRLCFIALLRLGAVASESLDNPTGWGLFASDARDRFGDTIGGIGSAIALEGKSWKRKKDKGEAYEGILYGLPDRGWNTQGTQNTQSRIHKFRISLEIVESSLANPAKANVQLKCLDTILLTGPDGTPMTGLDADVTGYFSYKGFPDLPVATFTGDGFGNDGPGGSRISLDAEGLVLGKDGTFWISDEYGPYIYQFDRRGKMIKAIKPPDALLPLRNSSVSFNAASPPIYNPGIKTVPEAPETGRANNQGLEALTSSPGGEFLYALLQSAAMQDGGDKSSTRRNTRLLRYRTSAKKIEYDAEYVVQLPLTPSGKVAGQSEIHFISQSQLLVLARDSGAGHGQKESESKYRNADIIDISGATNIKGKEYDSFDGAVASRNGELKPEIKPDCTARGSPQDAGLLNEKWESFALAPVAEEFQTKGEGRQYYLISFSDNDFITQNGLSISSFWRCALANKTGAGYINNGQQRYSDESGFNSDTQVLVFKVRLPRDADPLL